MRVFPGVGYYLRRTNTLPGEICVGYLLVQYVTVEVEKIVGSVGSHLHDQDQEVCAVDAIKSIRAPSTWAINVSNQASRLEEL